MAHFICERSTNFEEPRGLGADPASRQEPGPEHNAMQSAPESHLGARNWPSRLVAIAREFTVLVASEVAHLCGCLHAP